MKKLFLLFAAACCAVVMNAETYGLNVGGTQVTSDNAADIFGDGTASYDASLGELTLNNADIRVDYSELNKGAIVATGDLTIIVKGQNNYIAVNNMNAYTAAIQVLGSLTITSELYPTEFAKLQIVCTNGCALYAMSGNIWLLREMDIDIKGASSEYGCIKTLNGDVHIDGATVSMLPAWVRASGGLLLERSQITSPSDAVISNGKIVRSGTTTEYSNQQQVVISSLMRKLIYGASPKNKGNKVFLQGNTETQSQATGWVELGDYIHLTATPAEGYTFAGWYDQNDQLLSTDNPYSNQLMTENTTLIYGKFEEQGQGDTRTIITHVEVNNWDPSFIKAGMDWWCAHMDDSLAQVLQIPSDAPYKFSYTYLYNVTENDRKVDGEKITPGIYHLEINLRIDGDEALSYRFPDWTEEIAMTGTVNGQECCVTSPTSYPTWSSCFIYTPEFVVEAQGIESVQISEVSVQKVIREGQLLIEKNGKTYNALGTELK